jgi:hypothetical protein
MKVNELMIGDWFSFDNTLHRVCALKGDLKCNLIGYTDNSRLRKWITDSVAEPIRLTPNILLANGWRKVVYGEYTLYLIGDVGDPEFTVEYVSEYDCFYVANIKVEFVHEFQHALRLLGFIDMADDFIIR